MRVLVRVDVTGLDACVDDLAHLRMQMAIRRELAEHDRSHQLRDGARKRWIADQHAVHADIKRRSFLRQAYGMIESRGRSHQRGRGEDALAMRADDALVHIGSEAEVVGVNDQFAQFRKCGA